MKKNVKLIILIIAAMLVLLFWELFKPYKINNPNFVSICKTDSLKIRINLMESVTYFSGNKFTYKGDTLYIDFYQALMSSPFSDKKAYQIVSLKPGTQYLFYCNRIFEVKNLVTCLNFYPNE